MEYFGTKGKERKVSVCGSNEMSCEVELVWVVYCCALKRVKVVDVVTSMEEGGILWCLGQKAMRGKSLSVVQAGK